MLHPASYVEVQGTGEHSTFARSQLETLLDLAEQGISELFAAQKRVLGW
jgi:ribonuclease PH